MTQHTFSTFSAKTCDLGSVSPLPKCLIPAVLLSLPAEKKKFSGVIMAYKTCQCGAVSVDYRKNQAKVV